MKDTYKIVNPTPELAKKLILTMAKNHMGIIQEKKSSRSMSYLGKVIDPLLFKNQASFIDDYSTTFPGIIFLSFTPGDFSKTSFQTQIKVITHECTHLDQFRRDKLLTLFYIFNKNYRFLFEAQAYSTNMEITLWLTGRDPSIDTIVNHLKNYVIKWTKDDEEYMRALLESELATIKSAYKAGKFANPNVEELFKIGVDLGIFEKSTK